MHYTKPQTGARTGTTSRACLWVANSLIAAENALRSDVKPPSACDTAHGSAAASDTPEDSPERRPSAAPAAALPAPRACDARRNNGNCAVFT